MSRYYYDYYPPSRPRSVKGGIKAQSRRGTIGKTWWGIRWIETLESFSIGARLGRGKNYARSGQVLSIDIEKGLVKSKVRGSRHYLVGIKLKPFKSSSWKKIVESLKDQPYYVAKLLAGEIPEDFEDLLKEAGTPLFPERVNDLKTDCTCPDWSNPCKHIAAVYYLLAEEFDRDPFLLFELRGITRQELLAEVTGAPTSSDENYDDQENTLQDSVPLKPSSNFWQDAGLPEDLFGVIRTPPASAALPKRLGKFPFWRGEDGLINALEPVYQKASPCGLDIFQGETTF